MFAHQHRDLQLKNQKFMSARDESKNRTTGGEPKISSENEMENAIEFRPELKSLKLKSERICEKIKY